MLARARDRLAGREEVRSSGLERATNKLIRGDFRGLPIRSGSMGCVVAPNDPLIHLMADADRQRAIDEAERVLAPGGRLLLELLWWTPSEQARARSSGGLERSEAVVDARGDTIMVHEHWSETGRGFVHATYRFRAPGGVAAEASFRGRRWTEEELRDRLRRAGLRLVRAWGGFDGRPFEKDTGEALLVEAARV
jgi:SAM-dependent methyltransferase